MSKPIRLKRVSKGHYQYKHYNLIQWKPEEVGYRYLWCLSIEGTGMEDFRTLKQAKNHIMLDQEKEGRK